MGLVWSELKTVKQCDMIFHCDKDTLELDIFLCFAAHLLPGGPDEECIYITAVLKDLHAENILPKGDFSGTLLRLGSVNFVSYHPEVDNFI